MSYDPINDDKRTFTLDEMDAELKEAWDAYKEALNDKAKAESRTFTEWMSSFGAFMSW